MPRRFVQLEFADVEPEVFPVAHLQASPAGHDTIVGFDGITMQTTTDAGVMETRAYELRVINGELNLIRRD